MMDKHRAHPRERCTHAGGGHEAFGNGKVLDALLSEFLDQSFCCAKDTGGIHQLAKDHDVITQIERL